MFALYLIVHVYMATLGPTAFSHIKAMIVGYEEEPEEAEGDGSQEVHEIKPDIAEGDDTQEALLPGASAKTGN